MHNLICQIVPHTEADKVFEGHAVPKFTAHREQKTAKPNLNVSKW